MKWWSPHSPRMLQSSQRHDEHCMLTWKAFSQLSQVCTWDSAPLIPARITCRAYFQCCTSLMLGTYLPRHGSVLCTPLSLPCVGLAFFPPQKSSTGTCFLHWALLTASQILFPQHIVSHPIIFMALFDFLCQHICWENNSPRGQIFLIVCSSLK